MPMTYVKKHGTLGTAVFSPDYKYRYVLTRKTQLTPKAVWVMLNPSYATGERNDHTITKCLEFSRRWGFAGIYVVNLYAYISTDPRALLEVTDPVGVMNDPWLRRASQYAQRTDVPVVAAWGNNAPMDRAQVVAQLFPELYCLGVTASGQPKHPLRLAYDTPLQRWV